jgi:gliding motility-associated-like protein
VFIPNAFIPNDNSNERNRRFRPELTFIPRDYLLIIYNRRGKKIFESHNYDNPWKGQMKGGKKAPAGTYIYYLEVKNPGQPLIHKKGQVTLIYRDP